MENSRKKKTKVLVMALTMAVFGLLPTVAVAQGGGLFGRGDDTYNQGWLNSGTTSESGMLNRGSTIGATEYWIINNQGIGEPAPLGGGLVILLGAGLGYAALKRKEEEQ